MAKRIIPASPPSFAASSSFINSCHPFHGPPPHPLTKLPERKCAAGFTRLEASNKSNKSNGNNKNKNKKEKRRTDRWLCSSSFAASGSLLGPPASPSQWVFSIPSGG